LEEESGNVVTENWIGDVQTGEVKMIADTAEGERIHQKSGWTSPTEQMEKLMLVKQTVDDDRLTADGQILDGLSFSLKPSCSRSGRPASPIPLRQRAVPDSILPSGSGFDFSGDGRVAGLDVKNSLHQAKTGEKESLLYAPYIGGGCATELKSPSSP